MNSWNQRYLRSEMVFPHTLFWNEITCLTVNCLKGVSRLLHVGCWLIWYSGCTELFNDILIMVIELSGVQFGLKSYAWFQNWTSAQREFDLKSQVWFQTKIARHKVQLPLNITPILKSQSFIVNINILFLLLHFHFDGLKIRMRFRAKNGAIWE